MRYECIKTVRDPRTGVINFMAGDVYPDQPFEILDDGWVCLKNRFKEKNYFAGSFLTEHFRELEEIYDDPYTDHEREEYTHLITPTPFIRWVAWLSLAAFMLALSIYGLLNR